MREKLGREVRVFETSSISQRPIQVSSAGKFCGFLILANIAFDLNMNKSCD